MGGIRYSKHPKFFGKQHVNTLNGAEYCEETRGNKEWHERYNDFEIMQFTGLKDKNGKEIYDFDILNRYSLEGRLRV